MSNEHIRIDIVNSMFRKKMRDSIDVFGHVAFLLPFTIVMIVTGWPFFLRLLPAQRAIDSMPAACRNGRPSRCRDRIHAAVLSGHIRTDQAHRRDARRYPRPVRADGHPAEAEAERLLADIKPDKMTAERIVQP
jgi:hypothetical protein